jgi:VWFA-related protein
MRALGVGVTAAVIAAGLVAVRAQQAPAFRSSVNMLAVDALVIDRQGTPILGLLPDDFSVTVNNQPRRVVSATLVQYGGSTATSAGGAITSPISLEAVRTPGRVPDDGRVFVIAVDEPSFLTGDMRAAVLAAQRFIKNLRPTDMVGAYMFPFSTPLLDLTHDHAAVSAALSRAMGRRDLSNSVYHMTTDEIIEISAGDAARLEEVFQRECPTPEGQPPDVSCKAAIQAEALAIGAFSESEAAQRVYGLGELVQSLQLLPGHKTLLLLSGGMLGTNRVGGRPDIRGYMKRVGEQAARANVMLYVMHMDNSFAELLSPVRGGTANPSRQMRSRFLDGAAFAMGLENLASEAGGVYIPIKAGTGEPAFARVLRETTAYYLLGVEPTATDWDGRKLMVKVKANAKGATVRALREIIAK